MPVSTRKHSSSSHKSTPLTKNIAGRDSTAGNNPAGKSKRQSRTENDAHTEKSKKHQLQDGSRNVSTDDLPLKRLHASAAAAKVHQNFVPPAAAIDSEEDSDSSGPGTPLQQKLHSNLQTRRSRKSSKGKSVAASDSNSSSESEGGSGKSHGSSSDDSMDIQPGADESRKSLMAKKVISEMPVVLSKQRTAENPPSALGTVHPNHELASDVMNVDMPAITTQPLQPQPAWPVDTEIASPSGRNGHSNLRNQTPRMERILRAALPEVFFHFATRYALTRDKDVKGWVTTCVVTVATALGDTAVADRIHKDPKYAPRFASLLLNRVESWRSQMTNVAFDNVEGQYRLGGNDVKSLADRAGIISDLMLYTEGESYKYTFAFKHSRRGKSDRKSNTKPNMKKPYCHPILAKILRVCFKMDNGAYATVASERFKTGDGICELPDALIALSATLVHAALDFLKRGVVRSRKDSFKSSNYYTAYQTHLGILAKLEDQVGTAAGYHALKQKLYQDCTTHNFSGDTQVDAEAEAAPTVLVTKTNIVVIDVNGDSSSESDSNSE